MTVDPVSHAHGKHCFVVMPFGRNPEERKWFAGWYEVVIKTAVEASGYECILAAAEEQPGAINDEIRAHLAFDPMVVVDLGGISPAEAPNPNVMYELGIRHAFGMPVVVMAWENQSLPFDVSNQRAIMCSRGFSDIEPVKKRLMQFINAAKGGTYYRPMDAVGRQAALDRASQNLEKGSELAVLIEEIRDLRSKVNSVGSQSGVHRVRVKSPTVKSAVGNRKAELWQMASSLGYDPATWAKILGMKLESQQAEDASSWTVEEWKIFLLDHRPASWTTSESMGSPSHISDEFLNAVEENIGKQPWPQGAAREVAAKLDVTPSRVSRALDVLIDQGRFKKQADGIVFETDEEYLAHLKSTNGESKAYNAR